MNRRAFLTTLTGAAASTALPAPPTILKARSPGASALIVEASYPLGISQTWEQVLTKAEMMERRWKEGVVFIESAYTPPPIIPITPTHAKETAPAKGKA